jgi:hypothetical protein
MPRNKNRTARPGGDREGRPVEIRPMRRRVLTVREGPGGRGRSISPRRNEDGEARDGREG